MYTLKGELKTVEDTVQVSDSFKKREFVVIDASGQYAQTILFQAVQDRCELLDKVKVGDNVEVTFFLRGREWTNPKDGVIKTFNSLDAWRVDSTTKATRVDDVATNQGDDDLPF